MDRKSGLQRIHPLWWTAALVVSVVALITLSIALFSGKLSRAVPVMLTSDRAGLVMYTGARVKLRGGACADGGCQCDGCGERGDQPDVEEG